MISSSRGRFARRLITCLIILPSTVSSARSADEIGLSQVKPTSGRFVKTDRGYMVPYRTTIPGTDVTFEMVPIPGGTFRIGSVDSTDADRTNGFAVTVEPYWMGRTEVTWAEYDQYYDLRHSFQRFNQLGLRKVTRDNLVDAITTPSTVYIPPTPVMADKSEWPRHPAVSMTQYGARQYTKWLSKLTGRFYRLPSAAEWEYACRAGSSTRYSFGDDERQLSEYGWFLDNADEDTHPVGLKNANRWGLYDMHGNAAEWVLDEFSDTHEGLRAAIAAGAAPIHWPTTLHPRTVCGGSWDSDAVDCHSAARIGSSKDWQDQDPHIPTSPHWLASDNYRQFGFRILRPLTTPPADTHAQYWDADVDALKEAIEDYSHIQTGIVDPQLPAAIERLKQR